MEYLSIAIAKKTTRIVLDDRSAKLEYFGAILKQTTGT